MSPPDSPFDSDNVLSIAGTNTASLSLNGHSQSTLVVPDLESLKLATIMNNLDTSAQLCQYEVAGGGVCRDEGCTYVHVNRLLAEADGDGFDLGGA
jgi:hypothetical protein